MHQILFPLADATQFVGGKSYVFSAQSPPIGQNYNYLWKATDGLPQTSINESFIWTSPKVTEPTTVEISLQESSGPNGCTAESKLSVLVHPQPSPLVVTKTVDQESVLAGATVNFTFSVKNDGDFAVEDVNLIDTLSPGFIYQNAKRKPDSINGNMLTWNLGTLGAHEESEKIILKAQVDPSLCPKKNVISTGTSSSETDGKLKILAAASDPTNLPQIIDALSRNKTKLEVKLDSIRTHRDAFNKTRATLTQSTKTIAGANFTLNNYTNVSTGERLTEQLNSTGFLVASEYARPAKGDLMRTEYGDKGEILSDFYDFKPTKESITIEYDKPNPGYRTYIVRYYATGDTLIMTVDSYGNVISRQYEKRPGLLQISGPLNNCAKAYGIMDGTPIVSNEACVEVIWGCQNPKPTLGLEVTKKADREVAAKGDVIKYTYTVQNTGNVKIVSLTLNDDKLGLVILNEPISMEPGDELTYYGYYTVKEADTTKKTLINIVVATGMDPDGTVVNSDPARAEVKIESEDCVILKKTASSKVVKPGDLVTYTITYKVRPECVIEINDVVITDTYPNEVSFVSATPSPDDNTDNKWSIGTLSPGASGTITILIQVAQDIGNTSFDMGQGVTGKGFVNVHNDIRTNPVILSNKATMFLDGKPVYTAYADVNVGPPNTYAALREHGSGNYASEDVIKYDNSNRSMEWNKSLKATYMPTTFSLPKNRGINYNTKWIEKAKSKNYATGGSTNEEYTYANKIDREAYTKLDENGSTTITDTTFEGVGHIGLLKKDADMNRTWNASQIFESQEDYVGNFNISQMFDEYGKNVEFEKSVRGIGYVAGDRNIGNSQKSYESGTGKYQSDERISTVVNYIAKDINLTHLPTSYTYTPTFTTSSDLKWDEGIWSKTPNTLISERFSSAESLQRESTASGLNAMDTEAKVVGKADFRTIYNDLNKNSNNKVDIDELYSGNFAFKKMTHLTGVATYNRPHITLTEEAKVDLVNTTFIDYRITAENNGNHVLGPVYVKDMFPTGTEYITSSLRPSELTADYANWTLLSLGIGTKAVIDLRLNITEEPANLINRVQAAGMYSNGWVTAGNFSVVRLNWLTCCPPQITVTKTAKIDALDPRVVWYSLNLKNRETYTMVAFIMDQMPEGMMLLNSSLEPSENRSNLITWSILDLGPGESRNIVYRTRSEKDGVYVNQAHIEAFSVDGPDGAAADVEARVGLGAGGALSTYQTSEWRPPACFGLNCSEDIYSTDWIPCYTCSGGEPGNVVVFPVCASCLDTGDDNLP